METGTLSEIELSKYCREHGLYVEEVKQCLSRCVAANDRVIRRIKVPTTFIVYTPNQIWTWDITCLNT